MIHLQPDMLADDVPHRGRDLREGFQVLAVEDEHQQLFGLAV